MRLRVYVRRYCWLATTATTTYYWSLRSNPAIPFLVASSSSVASAMSSSSSSSSSASPRFRSWPITATKSLEGQLRSMGLEITSEEIDGTTGSSSSSSSSSSRPPLSDALVSVGQAGRGGTGSFISNDGLIITNWHVAYEAVRQASINSDDDQDYLKDGFVARTRQEELRGPNYEVWITKSCQDVSQLVVEVIQKESDPLQRANKVRDVMQEIAKNEQAKLAADASGDEDGSIRCDVQEMLPNENYVLFTYERLKDVRIVYVPPKSLGNFGGDTDNFEWPRHTADFTLLRAYVHPETGKGTDYSETNVPYKNKSRIQVQKDGVKENDFVFLLGFPGRTIRYAPVSRLKYSDEVAVPHMIQDFFRKLQLIDEYEKKDETAKMKLGGIKKGLANEYKRSVGKILMMKKLNLLQERQDEETQLVKTIPNAKEALDKLDNIYNQFRTTDSLSNVLEAMRGIYGGSSLLATGHALQEFICHEQLKKDEERESSYRERNLPFLFQRLGKRLNDIHTPYEVAVIDDALQLMCKEETCKDMYDKIIKILGGSKEKSDIESCVNNSMLRNYNAETLRNILDDKDAMDKLKQQDVFFGIAGVLYDTYVTQRDTNKALFSERDELFAKLLDYQREVEAQTESGGDGKKEVVFYPDCNGSLRISAGHVEGYNAADAIRMNPNTCLAGILDKVLEAKLGTTKESPQEEFECPERLFELLTNNSNNILNVPVNVLYSTDTVGGNSGSPVMNSKGEFVAINFDRQRQGLMNEFKWSKDYSRSIGVDIRYILWLIGEYDGAKHLIDEMLS